MMANKFYKYFLVVIGAGLFLYLVATKGWYPVAIVNSQWIMAQSLLQYEAEDESYRLALNKLIEDILTEDVSNDDLLASGSNIDKWLAEAKTNSSVIILTPKLRWNGQEVELNK